MAAALGFTACSEDDISVDDNRAEGDSPKGMVLRATVEQTAASRATVEQPAASRATISDAWLFDFATGDEVSVTNTEVTAGTYYTFTNGGTQFTSADAELTSEPATWYAYFPSSTIDLTGQSGTRAAVANTYALAGATAEATTGEGGLSITLAPQVAILVIDNQKGGININVKNSASTWVSGLAANAAGSDVTTATSQQNLLSVTETGTYYVAVPAGVQLAVKDGTSTIKSTGTDGLTAGRYYELSIFPFGQGSAKATIGESTVDIHWIQLWAGGPKFAEYNVGVTDGKAESLGGYYTWGGTYAQWEDTDENDDHNTGTTDLIGTDDTAIALWGSNWRMPTSTEYVALLANCEVEIVEGPEDAWGDKTIVGAWFKGKTGTAYASNSVYFPAAGFWPNAVFFGSSLYYSAAYWSSTLYDSENANVMTFELNANGVVHLARSNGCLVRAVLAE